MRPAPLSPAQDRSPYQRRSRSRSPIRAKRKKKKEKAVVNPFLCARFCIVCIYVLDALIDLRFAFLHRFPVPSRFFPFFPSRPAPSRPVPSLARLVPARKRSHGRTHGRTDELAGICAPSPSSLPPPLFSPLVNCFLVFLGSFSAAPSLARSLDRAREGAWCASIHPRVPASVRVYTNRYFHISSSRLFFLRTFSGGPLSRAYDARYHARILNYGSHALAILLKMRE